METSEEEPLSIESFSYSWLSNSNSNLRTPSFDDPPSKPKPSLGNSPPTSFDNPHEKTHNSFDFHTAISHSQAHHFVHADEVFSNGIIRPVFVDNPNHRAEALLTTKAIPVKPSNPVARSRGATFPHVRCQLPWKWRKSSEKILRKCLSYIQFPSCYNVEGCRRKAGSGGRADVGVDWRFREICSWNSSPRQSPPRTSHSVGHWSDNETSINEAILHCKRSIGSQ